MKDSLYKMYENTLFNNKYHLTKLLGSGQFGAVFQANQIRHDQIVRTVAIKIIRGDLTDIKKTIRECNISIDLDHHNILDCETYEKGYLQNSHVGNINCLGLVMEEADGGSLESVIENQKSLTIEQLLEITEAIACALIYLSKRRPAIVHQDIKPANILRVSNTWKLADFGASHMSYGTAFIMSALGTLPYAPPEALEANSSCVTPAWDVWSLGILMTELLTGQQPYQAANAHELRCKILSQTPSIPPNLPSPFNEIIPGCLTRDRQERWTAMQIYGLLQKRASVRNPSQTVSLPNSFNPAPKASIDNRSNYPQVKSHQNSFALLKRIALALASGVLVVSFITFNKSSLNSERIKQRNNSSFDTVSNFYESVPSNPDTALNLSSTNYQNSFKVEQIFWNSVKDSKIIKSTSLGQSDERNSFQVTVEYFMRDGRVVCEKRIIELLFDTKEQKWLIDKNIRLTDSTGC